LKLDATPTPNVLNHVHPVEPHPGAHCRLYQTRTRTRPAYHWASVRRDPRLAAIPRDVPWPVPRRTAATPGVLPPGAEETRCPCVGVTHRHSWGWARGQEIASSSAPCHALGPGDFGETGLGVAVGSSLDTASSLLRMSPRSAAQQDSACVPLAAFFPHPRPWSLAKLALLRYTVRLVIAVRFVRRANVRLGPQSRARRSR